MRSSKFFHNKSALKSFMFLFGSFILGYCIQITVHEGSHYIAGLLVGAKGGEIILHPFLNSKVMFQSVPSVTSQVFIGVMGPFMDIILAVIFSFIAWRKKSILSLPLLMWGALAFIGEGIGMIGNIAALPYSYDDVGQLMLLDISPKPLIPLCIIFILLGLVRMVLLMPLSGISPNSSIYKKLIAFFCSLPLYFGFSILYIYIFDMQNNMDSFDVRLKQFIISIVFAVLLAFIYKPMDKLMGRIIKTKATIEPKVTDIIYTWVGAIAIFATLFITYFISNT